MLGLFFVMFQPVAQTSWWNSKGPGVGAKCCPKNQVSNPSMWQLRVLINLWGKPRRRKLKPRSLLHQRDPHRVNSLFLRNPHPHPPSPSIIVPSEEIAPLPIDLKPSDLAIYKVVRGDTLWGIARKNGVSLANLLNANPNLDKSGRLCPSVRKL